MKIGKIINIRKVIQNCQKEYGIDGIIVVPTRTGKSGINLTDKTRKEKKNENKI